jgi:UDP-N-acetylenolpyruvoylglucosamine reductase
MCVSPATYHELTVVGHIYHNFKIGHMIVSDGTKILLADGIVKAVIRVLNSDSWKSLNWIADNIFYCASGVSLRDFCKSVSEKLYLGTEKLSDIPCHPEAIVMNARSHRQTISDYLISIEILDPNWHAYSMENTYLDFGYQMSSIPRNHIVWSISTHASPV